MTNNTSALGSREEDLIDAETIAKKVGYSRPEKVRALIKRNRTNLMTLGGFVSTRQINVKEPDGTVREVEDYLLNFTQARFIAALLPTPAAAVIGAFDPGSGRYRGFRPRQRPLSGLCKPSLRSWFGRATWFRPTPERPSSQRIWPTSDIWRVSSCSA